jgi:anti-sigma regulatory factor (Ser/Thr protein kinase)
VTNLIHRARLYTGPSAFIDAAVPFLREGVEAGEAVLAVVPAGTFDALREALGPLADGVSFREAAHWYSQPTRTIAAYSSFIEHHAGMRMRAVAEPAWACDTAPEIAEWTRYESIVNQAFASVDGAVLCLYDRTATPAEVLGGVFRTHPELVDDDGAHANAAYVDPREVYAEVDRRPLPPVPPDAREMPVDGIDLTALRAFVGGHAEDHGITPARLHDLLVATTEVATNAIRHGLPPVTCRTWTDGDDVVVDVTDAGHWRPDGLPGFLPPDPLVRRGFGLWGVRMLCPLVQLRTGPHGTAIRLRVHTH